METFIKNHSFDFQRTLVYKDTSTVIDLTSVLEISVLFRKRVGRVTLKTATYTGGTVERVTPYTSGVISVKFNPSDTATADEADYEAIVTVIVTDAEYDNSNADFAGLDNAFTLIG